MQHFERVGIDLLGTVFLSLSKNRWVVLAIDHLTRFFVNPGLITRSSVKIAKSFIRDTLLKLGAWHLVSQFCRSRVYVGLSPSGERVDRAFQSHTGRHAFVLPFFRIPVLGFAFTIPYIRIKYCTAVYHKQ